MSVDSSAPEGVAVGAEDDACRIMAGEGERRLSWDEVGEEVQGRFGIVSADAAEDVDTGEGDRGLRKKRNIVRNCIGDVSMAVCAPPLWAFLFEFV